MRKIKDNVDLKELENFGFKPSGIIYYKYREGCTFDFMKVNINTVTREVISYNSNGNKIKKFHKIHHQWILNIIEELTKAGLVEKVE